VKRDLAALLREHGIKPSAQRLAVAGYVLDTLEHPSADQVFARVRAGAPALSRATVYNTLNLFVAKGLLRSLALDGGKVLFDPKVEPHHHFVDEGTGEIHDLPWDALEVSRGGALRGLDVREVQVVLRGRRRARRSV
jgi:Fur family iron response transcriptional regulator